MGHFPIFSIVKCSKLLITRGCRFFKKKQLESVHIPKLRRASSAECIKIISGFKRCSMVGSSMAVSWFFNSFILSHTACRILPPAKANKNTDRDLWSDLQISKWGIKPGVNHQQMVIQTVAEEPTSKKCQIRIDI